MKSKRIFWIISCILLFGLRSYGQTSANKVYVTQLIYIRDGQEATFNEFEKVAMPLITKYNGRLLFRYRPKADNIIEQSIETPNEIHLVEFNSEQDLANFLKMRKEKNMFI